MQKPIKLQKLKNDKKKVITNTFLKSNINELCMIMGLLILYIVDIFAQLGKDIY